MPDPMLFVAPDFQQIPASQLVSTSPAYEELHQALHTLEDAIAALQASTTALQAQVADLETRVATLEGAG